MSHSEAAIGLERLPRERQLTISYEALMDNTEQVLRRVCALVRLKAGTSAERGVSAARRSPLALGGVRIWVVCGLGIIQLSH